MRNLQGRLLRSVHALLMVVGALLLSSSCSDDLFRRVPPSLASAALTKAAINLEKPASGRSRVIVFNGGTIEGSGYRPRAYSVEVYVDNFVIGALNPREAMVFDVAPGQYTFQWLSLGGKGLLSKIVPDTSRQNR